MKTVRILIVISMIAAVFQTRAIVKSNDTTKKEEVKMSANEKNKAVIRKLYEEALNKRDMDLLHDLISENYTGISGNKGADGFKEPVEELIRGFPDIQWKVQELIADEDKVVIRWNVEGTHTGVFRNFSATGKTISNTGIGFYELKEGKVANASIYTDRLGFLQNLEILPRDLSSLSAPKSKK